MAFNRRRPSPTWLSDAHVFHALREELTKSLHIISTPNLREKTRLVEGYLDSVTIEYERKKNG